MKTQIVSLSRVLFVLLFAITSVCSSSCFDVTVGRRIEKNGETKYRLEDKEKESELIKIVKKYNKIIQLNIKNADAYYNRGVTYMKLLNYERACEDFLQAIKLNPKYRGAIYIVSFPFEVSSFGYIELSFGRYESAIKLYNLVFKLHPNFPLSSHYKRGIAYHYLGKYEQAIRDYNKAIELNPKDIDVYYSRGLAYKKLGDCMGIKDYEIYLRLNTKISQSKRDSLKKDIEEIRKQCEGDISDKY